MQHEALIIIPTYNERDNVPAISRAIHETVPDVHVLFVDDNSPDGTGRVADELAAKDPRIRVLHRSGKLGLGTAYLAGFRHGLQAGYPYLIEMDADFSHDPKYLSEMLKRARESCDVVIGSRYVDGGGTENWGLGRKIISFGGGLYARTILGIDIQDMTAGFICYRRHVLETLDLGAIRSEGYGFQIELKYRVVKAGFRVEEMPIVFVDRRVGQSKMSKKIFLEALTMVWKIRFSAS
ncbi:MAG: polyprenol monophosphomannose synthase [Deltaproteobacteria bacterium]|nr:polyprenol monophosphomannose synthase [Deltaproteobacteria bacterium]